MDAYYNCMQLKNRRVKILTHDGQQYQGVIVNVDQQNVYLRPDQKSASTSAFTPYGYGYAYNPLITLSLFTLLAIALI
ncbi:hypothetical protein F4V43_12650 [Paenibacillus spiritus]|uniref:Cellobiose phosphorylase n=1 Tax=Paenibacillus spiritus TaxID=2496557 RepID=A0A5J5G9R0_9BACL|nr:MULTISPECIES: hypothetical protein [Paenibacillus]KAA9004274.1 hypothetical protein F4V43_12650 [Paenibacillus spiritus]